MLERAIRYGDLGGNRPEKGGAVAYRFEDSLDRWLRNELDTLYQEVLCEPLPPDLAELVRRCQEKLNEKDRNHGRSAS